MLRLLKLGAVSAALAVGTAGIAACGSSSSSKSSTSSGASAAASTSSAAAKTPTGTPVVIEVTGISHSAIGSVAETWAGAKAAARAINAKGGIKGHPVTIQDCDTLGSPTGEVACARKAVSGSAVATAGAFTIFNDAGYLSVLAQGKLDAVGDTSAQPVDYEAPNAYPIDFSLSEFAACASPQIRKLAGASKVGALVEDLPITRNDALGLAQSAKAQGAGFGSVIVPSGTTDMGPVVPRVSALDTNLVTLIINPGSASAFLAAAAGSGKTYSYCTIDGLITGAPLIALASAAKAFYFGASLPPLSQESTHPGLKQFVADMNAEKAAGDSAADVSASGYDSISLRSWLAVQDIAQVAGTLKDPTSRTQFDAAIKKAKVSNFGIIPNIDFAKPQVGGPFKRVFNATAQLDTWSKTQHAFVVVPGAQSLDGLKALGL